MAFVEHLLENLTWRSFLLDLTLILLFWAVWFVFNFYQTVKNLPPGPWGKIFLGSIPYITQEFHLYLVDLTRKFGDICSVRMGFTNIVVLSDIKLIKKAFGSKKFITRPTAALSSLLNGYGVVNSEGELWKSNRRYLINQKLGLRNHSWAGTGTQKIDSLVQREVVNLINTILNETKPGQAFDPSCIINCSAANVICSMVMSTRFRHDDAKFQRFMFLFDEGFRLFNDTGIVTFIPILKHLPGVRSIVSKLIENRDEMLTFAKSIIKEHKDNLDPKNPKDLVDNYLLLIDEVRAKGKTEEFFHGFDPDAQLEQIVLDLFSAGVETTKTSLLWSLIYMLHNPDCMKKAQEEIESVVGPYRLPEVQDMKHLPYTRATIYEILRRSSPVPMATTHSCNREVEFEGYRVPKNTWVIPLLYAVHHDPKYWKNPEEFEPERFLSEDGMSVVKPEHFIPFGTGQRMCIGDQLAERELFLFISSLLHIFTLKKDPEADSLPSLRGIAGVTLTPSDFKIILEPNVKNLDAFARTAQTINSNSHQTNLRTYG